MVMAIARVVDMLYSTQSIRRPVGIVVMARAPVDDGKMQV
jgi:hypothetical protein